MGSEKSARYAYGLDPQCQRGDNVSMDRRICRRAKEGAWSVGLGKSARYAYELESPSVKEATILVWTDKSTLVPEIDSEHGRQGQRRQPGTLMNWNPPVSKRRQC